jgi:hypothetical protein
MIPFQIKFVKTFNMKKLALFSLVISILFSSCINFGGKRVKGDGNIVKQDREVDVFDEVHVSGALDVYVRQGEQRSVSIEGDENLMKYIITKNEGDKLEVRTKSGYNIRPTQKMKIYVTSPEFTRLDVSGACNIIGENKISASEKLELEVSGAGDISMEADAPDLKASISGSGKVDLKGRTQDFDLELSGAAKATCFDLMSENTRVEISGAGSAEVYASVKLDAHVSGAGNVRYKGSAGNVQQKISGAGSVKKVD